MQLRRGGERGGEGRRGGEEEGGRGRELVSLLVCSENGPVGPQDQYQWATASGTCRTTADRPWPYHTKPGRVCVGGGGVWMVYMYI